MPAGVGQRHPFTVHPTCSACGFLPSLLPPPPPRAEPRRFAPLVGVPELSRAGDDDDHSSAPLTQVNRAARRQQVDGLFQDAAVPAPPPAAGGVGPGGAPRPELDLRETFITTLMQVMSFPRERALSLLQQHHFDLDEVFAHLLP